MKYIKFIFLCTLGSFLFFSCNDFEDDNLDFSNTVDPYVEFDNENVVNLWAGDTTHLEVKIEVAIGNDLTVFYSLEGDDSLQVVIPASERNRLIEIPAPGNGVLGQEVVTLVGVDDPNFSIGRGDPDLGLSTTQVTVNWRGPTAVDDEYVTAFETELMDNVSVNDNFPEESTFTEVDGPDNGTLVFDPSGAFTYTPDPGFEGVEEFTYSVCLPAPNDIACDTGTVTIVVEEDED